MGSRADMHIFIWAKTVESRIGGRLGNGFVGTIVSRIRNSQEGVPMWPKKKVVFTCAFKILASFVGK